METKPEPVRNAVTRVVKYRFKPSAELVKYMRGMQEEYASLVNAGVEGVQELRCHHAERYLYDIGEYSQSRQDPEMRDFLTPPPRMPHRGT